MRRVLLLLSAMAAALVMASAVAMADHPDNGYVNCNAQSNFQNGSWVCIGTDHADILDGTYLSDTLYALAGDDIVNGYDENDTQYGGDGNDGLYDMGGDDTLWGGPGNDKLQGSSDSDTYYGGTGNDTINATGSPSETTTDVDRIYGEAGKDFIDARDGYVDIIDCGAGSDTVRYDVGTDEVAKGCERKNPRR
jgi:Ca2+-binding RTX toxin-like protein